MYVKNKNKYTVVIILLLVVLYVVSPKIAQLITKLSAILQVADYIVNIL